MIESKMKELECSQDFSHYKSMGIFQDAQGNLFEILWLSSSPVSMKKIRSKMKGLACSQYWELSVAMETIVPVASGPKLNTAFPPTQ